MVRTRGLEHALGKTLGRRKVSDDDNDASNGEGLPHLPVGNNNRRSSSNHLLCLTTLPICWWNYSRSALQRRELRQFNVIALMFDYRGCETCIRQKSRHVTDCSSTSSATHVQVIFLDALSDLMQSGTYAWGVAALVHMYDNLNEAACRIYHYYWIYEHFPYVGFALAAKDYDERRPCACQWTSGKTLPVLTYRMRLNRLTPNVVCWISYDDHHSFREFETILPHPTMPSVFVEEMDDGWMQFGDYIAPLGDPPRVSSVQQYDTFVEPDVHQQPVGVAAPDGEDVDVHHPGHAVVAIADKLERLLNLRILTEGTEAYTIAEECLSIARSYISQPTVGHRSRHRQRTDGKNPKRFDIPSGCSIDGLKDVIKQIAPKEIPPYGIHESQMVR
ncbi:Protein MAIN-LIKE 2 [Glycine soja]